ncbi:MAG: 2-dehydro-3-deoxyphosphogluconate aldolase [Blastococcus sp.]|nr:2-dehydro-3-deoxyphosphogluconate aldolase [Blastococcus sp.]
MDVPDILRTDRVAAVVRAATVPDPRRVADTLAAGGVRLVEFTFTIPGVCEVLTAAGGGAAVIGAGTVLTAVDAHAAIDAGAQFVVTPAVIPAVAAACHERGVPVLLGAYTPGEVLEAHRLGSAAVKLFPASTGGPGHLKNMRGPFPQIEFVPSGGISVANAAAFLEAGAIAVFAGSDLISPAMVEGEQYDLIARNAKAFTAAVARN